MTQPYRGRTTVVIDHPSQDISWRSPTNLSEVTARLFAGINAGATGTYADTEVTVEQGGAQAYGTVTLSGVGGTAATGTITFSGSTGAWTVTINATVFSGTSAGDDDTEGDDLATQIDGDPTISALISANNSAGVVTLTAVAKGTAGNAITLAVTGTGVARSAATLSGGAQGSVDVVVAGTTVTTDTTEMTDAEAATAVAAAVTADATVDNVASASAAAEVVTVTALVYGTAGNIITLTAATDTGTATTGHLSGGKLSGGTAVTSNVLRRP
jgi:phage tail sheath gpL-like